MIRTLAGAVAGAAIILVVAYVFLAASVPAHAAGCVKHLVSWYGLESCQNRKDCRTKSGERFTARDMTAAMSSPRHLGEVWRLSFNGKSVTVRINDTGGFAKYGRFMDISKAAARRLGTIDEGVVKACAVRVK